MKHPLTSSQTIDRLGVPDRNQLSVARRTMQMSCVGALIMGGPNHKESIQIIYYFTRQQYKLPPDCTCPESQWKK